MCGLGMEGRACWELERGCVSGAGSNTHRRQKASSRNFAGVQGGSTWVQTLTHSFAQLSRA